MPDTILIVDESQLVREALSKILLNYGIEKSVIASVESIDDAIELAQFSTVDLVLCANNHSAATLNNFQNSLSFEGSVPFLLLEKNSAQSSYNLQNYALVAAPFTQERIGQALFKLTQQQQFSKPITAQSSMPADTIPVLSTTTKDSKPSILVIDDEISNIDVAAGTLRQHYRVIAAKSGKQALKILMKDPLAIDLILLDVMMPEMDGYQVCKHLKADHSTADIPVIFLSAKTQVEDIKRGFELGAVDYITKPINPELLSARVSTHVRLKQHTEALKNQVCALKENTKLREDIEKIVQHDLKGPLNNILFETHRLKDKTAAHSINHAVNNVVNMINNSLNVYKIEQGIYPLIAKRINLNAIVNDAINAFQASSNEKKIQFNLQGFTQEHYIIAEQLLCLSIFNNLIKNAIEASPNHSEISISLTEGKELLDFRIVNQGVIPYAMRETLFDKYSSSNHSIGTGLGTYSAKLMTEVQNGHISFDIINEEHTLFVVQLPRAV